ncbi:hypothetical protein [Herpetosiphon giganteus]|uniref:hypothetical protein n=1 Tax=Herpetosiphon giganteus TaxID=2029754 RepID=UPI001958F0ED|nr:hypothetical protein [Herpetosiphon giganteus]MBM7845688.1 hypothetical protein [Herpetosiphon giganteus]
MLLIDGQPLDQVLALHCQDSNLEGLVPTLIAGWLETKAEQQLVWERVRVMNEIPTIVPILMCPDDCDFSCTIVVIEVSASATTVSWPRVGYAVGETPYETLDELPASRLDSIKWMDSTTIWQFERTAYINAIQAFAMPESVV